MNNHNEWADPIHLFAEHPLMYTGTKWKFGSLDCSYRELIEQNEWVDVVVPTLGLANIARVAEQLAVPVSEPNERIDQGSLMYKKGKNQATSLNAYLSGRMQIEEGEVLIMPKWLDGEFGEEGGLQVGFVGTDVGVRDIYAKPACGGGVRNTSVWMARRNLYIPKALKRQRKEKELRAYVYEKLGEIYGVVDPEIEMIRAVDSAIAFVQVRLDQDSKIPRTRMAVGNSTVGVEFERHLLATSKGRKVFMDYVYEKYKGDTLLKERKWHPLAVLDNRAGASKTEDLREAAEALGIKSTLLTNGKDTREMELDLMEHVEGAPVTLFLATIMTVAKATSLDELYATKKPIINLYPTGMRDRLKL